MLDHFSISNNNFSGPVLITGAGGCIGAWTMAMLLKANVDVIAFDLTNNKRRPELLIENEDLKKFHGLKEISLIQKLSYH